MIYKAEVIRMWESKAGQSYVRYWSSSVKMKKSKKIYAKRSRAIIVGKELTTPERTILLLKLGKNSKRGGE